jgi:hypothetical protein
MIECPNCRHQEFVGTLFCGECGARLIHVSPLPAGAMARNPLEPGADPARAAVSDGPNLESGAMLGLRVVSTGELVSLLGRDNFTLGRTSKGQAIVPDIDLDPYQGFEHGVSRIHAEVRLGHDGVVVVDLDSANGTLVNSQRLTPQIPAPVHHGDIIQLGRLRLQLISRFHK